MAQPVVLGVDNTVVEREPAPLARWVGWGLFWLAIAAALIFFIFPIFWMLETSFKSIAEANSPAPALFGFHFTLGNYHDIFFTTTESVAGVGGTTTTATD